MFVIDHNACRIKKLKKNLKKSFALKDLGPSRKILGMQIVLEREAKKLLSSEARRFNMKKPNVVGTPLVCT